jgi:dolichol-phosphate mannosyltransferase
VSQRQNKILPSLSLVIPTYNERENIRELIPAIAQTFADIEYEILVVDDNSPDGTGDEVLALSKTYPRLYLIAKAKREGIGAAIRLGYNQAKNDVILSTDSDLSFSVNDMRRLYEKINEGYDLVTGCRHMAGGEYELTNFRVRIKGLFSLYGNKVVQALTRLNMKDFSANFRAIRRDTWLRIETSEKTNALLLEMILKCAYGGAKVKEIPVSFKDRKYGESKLNLWIEAPKFLIKLIKYIALYRFRGYPMQKG